MEFDHRVTNMVHVPGGDFLTCATCGEPVGRDRDVEWEHLDEPNRRELFSLLPPARRTWDTTGLMAHADGRPRVTWPDGRSQLLSEYLKESAG